MSAVARELFDDRFGRASRYVDLLAGVGIERGLIGPREAARLWDRHILNSVAPVTLIPRAAGLVDVGSGAGLPGLPLAILRPDLTVTLIEPLLRRATFLTEVVAELGLAGQVSIARSRAEDFSGSFDVVASRAVAPLDRLIGWCEPLCASGGVMLALKGRSAGDEVTAARPVLDRRGLHAEVLSLRAHPALEPATIVRVSRG